MVVSSPTGLADTQFCPADTQFCPVTPPPLTARKNSETEYTKVRNTVFLPKLIGLPHLPGMFPRIGKENNGRKSRFVVQNKQRMEIDQNLGHDIPRYVKTPREPQPLPSARNSTKSSYTIAFEKPELNYVIQPAWLAYDRHVLRFYAFTRTDVWGANEDKGGILRKVVFNYFLEDNTFNVVEPYCINSGIGIFSQNSVKERPMILIARQRCLRKEGGFLNPDHFRIGEEIEVYARKFLLYACDEFTRKFYDENLQNPQPPDEEAPIMQRTDVPLTARATMTPKIQVPQPPLTARTEISTGRPSSGRTLTARGRKNPLENMSKVCRFYGIMDDTFTVQFERRTFVIFYFLSDDTVKIREQHPVNSGRDNFPVFFKRSKMPLDTSKIGNSMDFKETKEEDYLTLDDLWVGRVINLLNLKFFIYDADLWTRDYFKNERNLILDAAIDVKLKWFEPESLIDEQEDNDCENIVSCSLNLKGCDEAKKKEKRQKLMDDDTYYGLNDEYCLHIKCKFRPTEENCNKEDFDRRFILRYYLKDNTLMILECSGKNSGHRASGKWLERGPHRNQATNKQIIPADLQKGQEIKIGCRWFEILELDLRTQRYFDNNCQPILQPTVHDDLDKVYDIVRETLRKRSASFQKVFRRLDKDGSGCIDHAEFKKLISQLGFNLTEEEIMQLVSYFDIDKTGYIDYKMFCHNSQRDYADNDDLRRRDEKKLAEETLDTLTYSDQLHIKKETMKECAEVRRALREISTVIHLRPYVEKKMAFEYTHLHGRTTEAKIITPKKVYDTYNQCGFYYPYIDMERVYHFLNPNNEDMDIMEFINLVKCAYHDLFAPR